jgi:galactose mutarotase-like enzyme
MAPDPGGGFARTLSAGDLEAVFLPGRGMLGASLLHRGAEILRRVEDLDASAAKGSTAGIPLLHPWANRLAGLSYRAAGREVTLEPSSPILHFDNRGLPIHGVPWGRLTWVVVEADRGRLVARLDWSRADLLAVFPYPHSLEMAVTLEPGTLTLETTLVAGAAGPVPVAFGFHPYVGLPGAGRGEWRLALPTMRRLGLDGSGIPTGAEEPFEARDAPLGDRTFDDGFRLESDAAAFTVSGGGRRIALELLAGYRYAQVYAPPGQDLIALEPMTAPTNALASGRGLALVEPGGRYRAAFRISVGRQR